MNHGSHFEFTNRFQRRLYRKLDTSSTRRGSNFLEQNGFRSRRNNRIFIDTRKLIKSSFVDVKELWWRLGKVMLRSNESWFCVTDIERWEYCESEHFLNNRESKANVQLLTFWFDWNTSYLHLSIRTLPYISWRSSGTLVRVYKISRNPTSVNEHGRSIGTL